MKNKGPISLVASIAVGSIAVIFWVKMFPEIDNQEQAGGRPEASAELKASHPVTLERGQHAEPSETADEATTDDITGAST
ncbi:MAG TPA: hypothetical protein VE954_00155, partial [Oligoflexus sp.]|uniref:hypothetical protein n=1 Tax=Oligoflexus sp. TaxID=1971216 RepID=UPI002D499236